MHKLAQTGTIFHLSMPYASSMQTLDICVRPNDDLGAIHINLYHFQVIFDSSSQLIRSISTTCFVVVQEFLLELVRMELLAGGTSSEATACEAQEEAAHNVVISIGINQHHCKTSTMLQALDCSLDQNNICIRSLSPHRQNLKLLYTILESTAPNALAFQIQRRLSTF